MSVTEEVALTVSVQCHSCKRTLTQVNRLPGDSVRTGNTTQRAGYWLDSMTASVNGNMKIRGWKAESEGVMCAHCLAAKYDPKPTELP